MRKLIIWFFIILCHAGVCFSQDFDLSLELFRSDFKVGGPISGYVRITNISDEAITVMGLFENGPGKTWINLINNDTTKIDLGSRLHSFSIGLRETIGPDESMFRAVFLLRYNGQLVTREPGKYEMQYFGKFSYKKQDNTRYAVTLQTEPVTVEVNSEGDGYDTYRSVFGEGEDIVRPLIRHPRDLSQLLDNDYEDYRREVYEILAAQVGGSQMRNLDTGLMDHLKKRDEDVPGQGWVTRVRTKVLNGLDFAHEAGVWIALREFIVCKYRDATGEQICNGLDCSSIKRIHFDSYGRRGLSR